jgi:hypothetical protein
MNLSGVVNGHPIPCTALAPDDLRQIPREHVKQIGKVINRLAVLEQLSVLYAFAAVPGFTGGWREVHLALAIMGYLPGWAPGFVGPGLPFLPGIFQVFLVYPLC